MSNQVRVPPQKTERVKSAMAAVSSPNPNGRHFVRHDYHDHSKDTIHDYLISQSKDDQLVLSGNSAKKDAAHAKKRKGPRGGVSVPFPTKLHIMLSKVEEDGFANIISWQPHGRCFVVHEPTEFVEKIMPIYFNQSKLTSFQRQLNLYGFSRLTTGRDRGGYYNELFLRHKLFLTTSITRLRVKGVGIKGKTSPETEPDFYSMPVMVSDPDSSEKSISLSRCYEEDVVAALEEIKRMHVKRPSKRQASKKKSATCDSLEIDTCASPNIEKMAAMPPALVTPEACRPITQISFFDSVSKPSSNVVSTPCTHTNQSRKLLPSSHKKGQEERIDLYPPFMPSDSEDSSPVAPHTFHSNDTIMFEGKQFHYLDSFVASFVAPESEEEAFRSSQAAAMHSHAHAPMAASSISPPRCSSTLSLPNLVSNLESNDEDSYDMDIHGPILSPSSSSSSLSEIANITQEQLEFNPDTVFSSFSSKNSWLERDLREDIDFDAEFSSMENAQVR